MRTARAMAAELVAAFVVVLFAAGATITGGFGLEGSGIALATGFAVAAAIAATLEAGGGKANPAVTIGLWVVGRIPTGRAVGIVLAQLLGGVAAAGLLRYVTPGSAFAAASGGTPTVASGTAVGKAVVVEAVCTFVLMFVYTATVDAVRATRSGALWVGLTVAAAVLVFGPYTGVAVNPARWLGPALVTATWSDWYVWLVGPIAGAILGAVAASALLRRDTLDVP